MTEDKRTEFAMAAVDFASLFNTTFGSDDLSGHKVSLTAPEGQSTGGGVQAVQHVTLSAEGRTIVVASCNNVEKTAELRTFDHVSQRYKQQFNLLFPVERIKYDELKGRLIEFFKNQSMQVTTAQPPPPQAAAPKKKNSAGLIIGLVVLLLAIGGGLAWYFLYYKS
jgi:hypothetical protein